MIQSKPEWQTLATGFWSWLWTVTVRNQPSGRAGGSPVDPADSRVLNALLDRAYVQTIDSGGEANPRTNPPQRLTGGVNPYVPQRSRSNGANFFAFVAAHYGLDCMPRLLRGWRDYSDWESLSPAVFGVSAAELQATWLAEDRTFPSETH